MNQQKHLFGVQETEEFNSPSDSNANQNVFHNFDNIKFQRRKNSLTSNNTEQTELTANTNQVHNKLQEKFKLNKESTKPENFQQINMMIDNPQKTDFQNLQNNPKISDQKNQKFPQYFPDNFPQQSKSFNDQKENSQFFRPNFSEHPNQSNNLINSQSMIGNNQNQVLKNIQNSNLLLSGQKNPTNGLPNYGNLQFGMLSTPELLNFDQDFLSEDAMFLISNEDNNLASYREIIEKEKLKLKTDFDFVVKDLTNMFEESKFKIMEAIDDHYKLYVSRYKEFKADVLEFKNIKSETLAQTMPQLQNANQDYSKISNPNLMRELEDMRQKNHLSKIYSLINARQKEHHIKINSISKQIMQQFSSVSNYYNSENLVKYMKEIKQYLHSSFSIKLANMSEMVKPMTIYDENAFENQVSYLNQQNLEQQLKKSNVEIININDRNDANEKLFMNNEIYISNLNNQQNAFNQQNNDQQIYFQQGYPNQNIINQSQTSGSISQNNQQKSKNNPISKKQYSAPFPLDDSFQYKKQAQNQIQKQIPQKDITLSKIAENFRVLVSNQNIQPHDISLEKCGIIHTNHDNMVLCIQMVSNDIMATGSKDATIELWKISTNTLMGKLEGHKGSICCLSSFKFQGKLILASGSDHGDSSIILWDVNQQEIHSELENHKAAVVALVPLENCESLISASYDKEIIIWNVKQGKIRQKLNSHNSSVTSLCLTRNKERLASSSLDNEIIVWKINYRETNKGVAFESCYSERTLKNSSFICTMNSLAQNDQILTGDKAGKIKFWDLSSGQVIKTLTANVGPIIEILLIENYENKNNEQFILSCSTRDSSIVITDSASGQNQIQDLGDDFFVEFGCGVNPKINFGKNGDQIKILAVNQNLNMRQVVVCDLNLGESI